MRLINKLHRVIHFLPLFLSITQVSCIQSNSNSPFSANKPKSIDSHIPNAKKIFHDKRKKSLKEIKFSENHHLNLISDIKIKFSNKSNWPEGSYLIILLKKEVIFLGLIENESTGLTLTVPFNATEVFAKIISPDDGIIYVDKKIKIKNGTIKI